jgi:hypothetical protein
MMAARGLEREGCHLPKKPLPMAAQHHIRDVQAQNGLDYLMKDKN